MMGKNPIQTLRLFFRNTVMYRHDIDVEERARRRLFIIFICCIMAPLLFSGTLQLLNNLPIFGITYLLLAALLISFIFILRKIEQGRILFRITAFMALLLLAFWTCTGANKGHTSIWVMSMPPFVYFLLGRKEGSVWSAAIFITTLVLFFTPLPWLNPYQYDIQFIARHLATLTMVILFTYHFESARHKYKKGMVEEHDRLLKERDHLDTANLMLQREIHERELMQDDLNRHKNNLEAMVASRTEELKVTNQELAENERRYRLLAENVTDLIWATDMDLNFIYFSPSIIDMFGYTIEEAMHLTIDRLNTPRSFDILMHTYEEQLLIERAGQGDPDRSVALYLDQIKKDGTPFPVEMNASFIRDEKRQAVGIVGISRDITDRMRSDQERAVMQAQLAQAQKREAIGTLAGGLAHDFNNMLGGIIGSIDLVRLLLQNENLVNREEIEYYLNLGLESSHKSVNFIKQLLTLSARHELNLVSVDITTSLKSILAICKNSLPKSVLLDFHIPAESIYIMAEPSHIEQVFLNLCINAAHAMTLMRSPDVPAGGTLTLTVETLNSDKLPTPAAGSWVKICITDTGIGMDAETLGRIFEPFFTTKKVEEGTGLGLATTLSIVKQHGGLIDVSSTPGKGSSFAVFLPVTTRTIETSAAKTDANALHRGSGLVLVVDDEKFILDVTSGMLHRCGYEVITAVHPRDGIAIFRERHAEIAAVLLDLSMPGMTGLEVFRELIGIDPNVRTVISSGMIDIETREKALFMGVREVIQKPFSIEELAEAVARVMA